MKLYSLLKRMRFREMTLNKNNVSSAMVCRLGTLCVLTAMIFSACNGTDPIKEKRNSIAEALKREQEREQLRISEHYDFKNWSAPTALDTGKSKPYVLPIAKGDTTDMELARFWKSASNLGYTLVPGVKMEPDNFPVYFAEDPTLKHKVLKLETKKGFRVDFLNMGSHVVPGSIYNGKLNPAMLFESSLEVTLFGSDYALVPFKLSASVKYKAGAQMINGLNNKKLDTKDKGSIVAVFYEVDQTLIKGDDMSTYLTGLNLHNDPRVIAKAVCEIEDTEGEDWVKVESSFTVVNKEAWEALDFKTKKYRLALVLSSSYMGDKFLGAIGSTLLVDKLEMKGEPLSK